MKYLIGGLLFYALMHTACNKKSMSPYTGSYYVRIPLAEPSEQNTYFVPGSSFDGPYLQDNAASFRKGWKFVAVAGKGYNIEAADSASMLITELGNFPTLAPRSSAYADQQLFKIIPSRNNPNLVAFQSNSSGKYIQLNYCYKQGETWGYSFIMADSSGCAASQIINLSGQADTCYCVYQYLLLQ